MAREVLERSTIQIVSSSPRCSARPTAVLFSEEHNYCISLNLFSQNVAAIVTTAQATDSMIAALFGDSYALNVPHHDRNMEGCKREGLRPLFAWHHKVCY